MHEYSLAAEIVKITLSQVAWPKRNPGCMAEQQAKRATRSLDSASQSSKPQARDQDQFEPTRQRQPERNLPGAARPQLTGLKLKIGVLAGVFPDSLRLYLDLIFNEQGLGPIAVEIESVPAQFQCRCGHTYTADLILSPCPVCNGFERELIAGNQCVIETIEMADPDTAPSATATAD